MASIKIGSSFFNKSLNDYASWKFAWVRELAQNSIDAPGSTNIEFKFEFDGVHTIAQCANNGSPMDENTLVEKFLSIGESGKNFTGSVGGFGKAKELIAFAHDSYTIRTGDLLVTGSGAYYEIERGLDFVHGTITTVKIVNNIVDSMVSLVEDFCNYAQWDGVVKVNGVVLSCDLKKGSLRRELSFGKVYSNNSFKNVLVVRMCGIPMFSEYVNIDKCVIVELTGRSVDVLTSNRDSLVYTHRRELRNFIDEITLDKSKALKSKVIKYTVFDGSPLGNNSTPDDGVITDGSESVVNFVSLKPCKVPAISFAGSGDSFSGSEPEPADVRVKFVLKNETDLVVPDYYLPGDNQSYYASKLCSVWGRLILELYRLFKVDGVFSVGFVFCDDAEAQFENSNERGRVYYINPAVIVEQGLTKSKSFKKRFLLTERNRLLAIAVHEFVHGIGYSQHDSDYAAQLTDAMWKVMDDRQRFNWCFN